MATRNRNIQHTQRFKEHLSEHRLAYLFVAPAVLILTLLLWLPFFRGVWISLHEWPILGGERVFIGLENYAYFLFEWEPFWTSVKVTVLQTIMVVPQVFLGLVVSLALYHTTRFTNVLNSVFLLPYIIPPVASGTILTFFFDPDLGPFFEALTELGILEQTIYWGSNGDAALAIILGATVWTFWPWVLLVLMGARAGINDEYYETARVYGASRWQMFRRITLPRLKGTLLVVFALRTIYNLTNTAQVWQMTRGGPGYETTPLGLLLFRFGFEEGDMGLASTAGIFLILIGLLLAIVFFVQFERTASDTEEALENV